MSVSDLSSLEEVVEENTLVRKDEFDRDGDLVEDGNGVSVGSILKKRKVAPSQTHLIRDLVIDLSNWTTTAQLIRKTFVSNNNHMGVIFSDGVKCVKGVIYLNLCSKFENLLEEGKTYTLSKCRLKEYKGPVHNLPMLALQMEFSAFTEIYLMDSDPVVTRHYPIPITSLRDAKDLKHNNRSDLDCIVKDSSNEVIIFSHSEKSKKEVFVYDSSRQTGTFSCLSSTSGMVRDAKVTIFREQMYLGLSFSGKILLTPVSKNSAEYETVCKWHKKKCVSDSSVTKNGV
ncbi:Uncharacterized protein APZ42_025373 [Daphnia magna]|uniref:Uncharacterized protein n=1 Tax=Daphnia magna TaxID=35525 RepID=A0A164T579_9CRUS|nr:Uncharacterized protein APZ42_025373 [Daphnia magna]